MTHFACNHLFHWQEARNHLSLQVLMMLRYLLWQKRKNLVLIPQTTEEETNKLLEVWAPKFSKLRGASQREKIKIWNEIYSLYKERCLESQRTLQQVKKWQQNLGNEYKQLKKRTRSTGEAGIKKIKENFPYFDIFDEVMGHWQHRSFKNGNRREFYLHIRAELECRKRRFANRKCKCFSQWNRNA